MADEDMRHASLHVWQFSLPPIGRLIQRKSDVCTQFGRGRGLVDGLPGRVHDAIIEKDKSIAAWVERVAPRAAGNQSRARNGLRSFSSSM
jgi:hypothetical protein